MTIAGTFATIQQGTIETVNLSQSKIKRTGLSRTPGFVSPDRYTNPIFFLGDQGQSIEISGVWTPDPGPIFQSTGDAWISSAGVDPIPTIEKWERTGQILQYNDETGTISSVAVTHFSYKLMQGVPLANIIYYEIKIRETLQ